MQVFISLYQEIGPFYTNISCSGLQDGGGGLLIFCGIPICSFQQAIQPTLENGCHSINVDIELVQYSVFVNNIYNHLCDCRMKLHLKDLCNISCQEFVAALIDWGKNYCIADGIYWLILQWQCTQMKYYLFENGLRIVKVANTSEYIYDRMDQEKFN